MAGSFFPYVPIPKTIKCFRCEQQYPAEKAECPHCTGLSDQQVEALKRSKAEYDQAHSQMGKTFLLIAGVLGVFVLLMILI